jgi:hypothetical protein
MKSDYIFFLFVAVFVGTFVWKYFRSGSLTGALLGGKISKSIGEIQLSSGNMSSRVMRVYSMKSSDGEKFVGLSIVSKAAFGASMAPFRLTNAQAGELALMLQQASNPSGAA